MLYIPGEKTPALYIISAIIPRNLKGDLLGRVVYLFRVLRILILTDN
jgi:hypothetical protein